MEKKYYNLEQILHNIHDRLSTNDWKIMITFGDLNTRLSMFEAVFSSDAEDFTSDEVWIEKLSNSVGEILPEVTPIIVGCMKREPNIHYDNYSIETPLADRKDVEIVFLGNKKMDPDNIPAEFKAEMESKKNWFVRRLQFYIDKKNGINSSMGHVSQSQITSTEILLRNLILCDTVRIDSVMTHQFIEKEILSLNDSNINNHSILIDEKTQVSKSMIEKILKIVDVGISLDNQNFVAWQWKGFVLYKDGNYEDAEQCYRSANMINPGWTDSLFYEGKMMVLQGFPQRGLEKINKAIIQQPERLSYRVFKANVLKSIGQYSDASAEYGEAKTLFEKLDYPVSYLQFILANQYFCLSYIEQFVESKIVLESLKETMVDGKLATSLFDEMSNPKNITSHLVDKVEKDLNIEAFTLTEDVKENIKKITNIFKNLDEFIWWKDQYWSKKAFDWIREACLTNDSIKEIRILTSLQKENEYVNRPFKKKMDQIQKFLNERNCKFELRIVADEKINKRFHGRLIISKSVTLNVPSVNNFCNGTDDVVSPVVIPIEDTHFEEWWEKSTDFYEFYGKKGTFQNTTND